jgi:glycosyltransferase, group 2 family protein
VDKKKIAAIVVTYNRCDLLVECLEALLKFAPEVDVIVINNASTDETESVLQKYIKESNIIYYNTEKNIGGAGGFNLGIKKAYLLGYKYFWLMDDDTIVQENSLRELLVCVKELHGKFGFVSSEAVWVDGTECKMNRHKMAKNKGEKYIVSENALPIKTATFVSFFTTSKVIEDVGLPIKDYFIWGDDTEYSLRISRKYPCYYAVNSKVIHKMKENKSTAKFYQLDDLTRIDRISYSVRNDVCTYKRRNILEFFEVTMYLVYNLLLVIIKDNPYKRYKIRKIMGAYIKGLFSFSPSIEYVCKRK